MLSYGKITIEKKNMFSIVSITSFNNILTVEHISENLSKKMTFKWDFKIF